MSPANQKHYDQDVLIRPPRTMMRITRTSILLVLAFIPMAGGSKLRRNGDLAPDELATQDAALKNIHQRLFREDSVAQRNMDENKPNGGNVEEERSGTIATIRHAQELETLEENTEEALETRHDDPPREHDVAGDSILLRSSESLFVTEVYEGSTGTTRQRRDTRPEVRRISLLISGMVVWIYEVFVSHTIFYAGTSPFPSIGSTPRRRTTLTFHSISLGPLCKIGCC
jgi:hypothetical protein